MKLKIAVLLMLVAFISLPTQAQNSKGQDNKKDKKEKIDKQIKKQKNKVKEKDEETNKAKEKGQEKAKEEKEELEKKYLDKNNDDDYDDDDDDVNTKDDDGFDTDDDDDGKTKEKKKEKEKNKDKDKGKDKTKSNNGNAYGKDKYGLEGREFGQERARQAKLKNKETKETLNETVISTQTKLPTMKERIDKARNILLEQKPQLSTEVFQAKTLKLEEAEKKMLALEKLVLTAQTLEKSN